MSAGRKGRFATTEWSLVTAAGDGREPAARLALARLCEAYWAPVYGFIRSRGHGVDDARDLTQGFFAALLEHDYLRSARRERGRFRSFLLVCARRYLSDQRDRERAVKRGAGLPPVPLDVEALEAVHRNGAGLAESPERVYERRWALVLMERVTERLEREAELAGTLDRFRRLRPLIDGTGNGSYRELAQELDVSEGALKVAVHRLRRRFGRLLREEVARTVEDGEKVDAEIRHIFDVLST